MSHNVVVKGVAIKSIPTLERAVRNLAGKGIPISMEKRSRFKTYPGQNTECDYAISIKGANHEIGVKANPKIPGEYALIFDPFAGAGRGIGDFLGAKVAAKKGENVDYAQSSIGLLAQEHALCVAEDQFDTAGWSFERQIDTTTGEQKLVAQMMS